MCMYLLTTFNSLSLSIHILLHLKAWWSGHYADQSWKPCPPCWPISKKGWVQPPPPTLSLSTNSSVIPGIISIVVRIIFRNKTMSWTEFRREESWIQEQDPIAPLVLILPACVPFEKSSEWKAGTKTRDKRQWLYYNMRRCFNSCRALLVCALMVVLLFCLDDIKG